MTLIRWLAAFLLLTASLGQLNRLFIGDGSDLVLYANDVLIGGLAVWYVFNAILIRRSWRIPPVALLLFAWMIMACFSLLWAWPHLTSAQWLISLSYLVRYVAYVLVFFFVAYDSLVYAKDKVTQWQSLRWWLAVIFASGLLMAISGFLQLYFIPDLAALTKYGWDPHINRLVTAMLDPNYAGCYFSLIVGLAVSLFLHVEKNYALRLVLLAYIAVIMLALLLTFSRSGYIMVTLILGSIALVRSRILLLVGAIIAVIIVFSVPRIQERIIGAIEVDASAQPRIVSWQNSWEIIQENQLLGVGFNSYRYAQDRYGIQSLEESGNSGAGADSSWLFIIATTGWLGALWYVASYVGLFFVSVRLYMISTISAHRAIALAMASILFGLGVASQFNNALFYPWIVQLVWVYAGLVVGLYQLTRESTDDKA